MEKSFTMHDLPRSERPHERLQKQGAEALSTAGLLALLMGGGTRGQSVIMTAQTALARFGNLQNLASASIQELSGINGIGSAKACQIKAAHVPVKSPEEAVESIRSKLKGKKKEHFYLLCLDTRNRVTDADQVS